jgi:hypothetical protein
MSTIKTNPAIPGKVATAAEANATYAAIQTGTAALSDLNEQTEWATWNHIDSVTQESVFTSDVNDFCNSVGIFDLLVENFTVVDLGGTPMRMTYAPPVTYQFSNEFMRVHADINVDDVGEINLPSILNGAQDCFFLQLWYRDGLGVYHAFPCKWGYSVTNMLTEDTTAIDIEFSVTYDDHAAFTTYAMHHPRRRLRCSVTGFIPIVASGIDRIELRARLVDNAVVTSVSFKEATMTSMMIRR